MPLNIQKLDTALDPTKEEERNIQTQKEIKNYEETFGSLDLEKSFPYLFELLWYSQLPCTDVKGLTSEVKDELSMIKRCFWKNRPISCNSIFQKRPTDRGMCCTFNMETAENILKESHYASAVALRQSKDAEHGFEPDKQPSWFVKNNEPTPEPGIERGLTLIVDRHSDKLTSASVSDNFIGFPILVDDKTKFPLLKRSGKRARPGMETNVEISALQVHAFEEIRQYSPEQRNCYFPDEKQLKYHRKYSLENCLFECELEFASACLTTCNKFNETCDCNKPDIYLKNIDLTTNNDTCTPWFYPLEVGKVGKFCNPWNTKKFKEIIMRRIPNGVCKKCLPDCSTTKYETSVSYAELVKCDSTTVGSSGKLCDLITSEVNPAPWMTTAQNEFEFSNQSIPWYLNTGLLKRMNTTARFSDKRSRIKERDDDGSEIFAAQLKKNPTYDAFRTDIGIINVYIGDKKISYYIKENRMTNLDFMYQIGGRLGFFMGISILSLLEIMYWIILRIFTFFRICKN